jgi:hypothetical protein
LTQPIHPSDRLGEIRAAEAGNCCIQQAIPHCKLDHDNLDHQRNTIPFQAVSSFNSLEPRLTNPCDIFAVPNADLFLIPRDITPDTSVAMAGMARHGSVGAFSGFSVCQPALGASLQWLPAIGTAELDDMINAFLPGPASIQDKRAHIAMDFFEYSRQTGETFKFYPVPSTSFTPVTASPATSALYDSGYASSFNPSPVLSDTGSWTQSPVSFAPAATDARTKARSCASKKSSTSSSRQQTVDFAHHPGMRILTKDGRDVTNSASRGCKTKEQRDHAHLMRIIKACDSCRKKKIRCDPSHRKRTASQTSTAQAEQKPAKRPRKVEESPPVAVVGAPTDFVAADAFASETLSFPTFEPAYPQDFEEFWSELTTHEQEPVAAAAGPAIDDFLFDSFIDLQSFYSPSSGSSATSPSQILTPSSSARSGASPITASDVVADVAGEFAVENPTVPYLNPGVAHGTNYVDFNLYSPGPEVIDEDPVLQMRELRSPQQSPQSPGLAAHNAFAQTSSQTANTSPVDLAWYYDPGDTVHVEPRCIIHGSPTNGQMMTNHNRLVQERTGVGRPPTDGQPTNHMRLVNGDGDGADVFATSSTWSPVSQSSAPAALCSSTSTVVARAPQSSVSPGTSPRPRRVTPTLPDGSTSSPDRSPVSTKANQPGVLVWTVKSSLPTTARPQPLQGGVDSASPATGDKSCKAVGVAACGGVLRTGQGCPGSTVPRQPLAGSHSGSSARVDGQHVVQPEAVAVNAVLATTPFSTLPTRCNVAGEDVKYNTLFFQLAVFGLVSILCASALQAHLASQVNLVNILAITSISLARLAPRCAGPSSATWVASETLPPPTPSGIVDNVKSKIQPASGSLLDFRSTVSRRARHLMPRLPSVRALRL